MRWQDGALGDLTGSDLKCLSRAAISMVHPVALQHLEQTSWREKHPVVVALAPYTTILRAFWPCGMLDGEHQRALMAASFVVFASGPSMFGMNAEVNISANIGVSILARACGVYRASTATATMAERSRRTKGSADKLAEYKRIREGGSRKWKVRITQLALDRLLTRRSARGRCRAVRRGH